MVLTKQARDRKNELQRKRYKENPKYIWEYNLKWRYGISSEQYSNLLTKQDYKCAACGNEFGIRGPQIDHDHSCCPGRRSCGNCVRGLLCNSCNLALGCLGDSEDRIISLVKYLRKD